MRRASLSHLELSTPKVNKKGQGHQRGRKSVKETHRPLTDRQHIKKCIQDAETHWKHSHQRWRYPCFTLSPIGREVQTAYASLGPGLRMNGPWSGHEPALRYGKEVTSCNFYVLHVTNHALFLSFLPTTISSHDEVPFHNNQLQHIHYQTPFSHHSQHIKQHKDIIKKPQYLIILRRILILRQSQASPHQQIRLPIVLRVILIPNRSQSQRLQ